MKVKDLFPPVILTMAAAILTLALWALSFSYSCRSDGCIGIIFPAGASALVLAIQLLGFVPYFGYKRHKSGKNAFPSVALWAAISIAAFAIPIALVK
jgi:hypothetical protein